MAEFIYNSVVDKVDKPGKAQFGAERNKNSIF